jgi:hypothetical protein
MRGARRIAAACAVMLAALGLAGCSLFGGQPSRTAQPKTLTPSPARTEAVNTLKPGKTASQDTAGAETRLPEAATAAGATTSP